MKNALEIHRFLAIPNGNLFPIVMTWERSFQHLKSVYFINIDTKRANRPENFENDKLQTLHDKDNTQTQQMIAHQLNVILQATFDCLKAMENIEKNEK